MLHRILYLCFSLSSFTPNSKLLFLLKKTMNNFNKMLPAAKIWRSDAEEAGFPSPISHPGLLKGCGEHDDKFSLATESLHIYENFLTFPSRRPWSWCLLIDVCSIIFSCHFTQKSLEKKCQCLMKTWILQWWAGSESLFKSQPVIIEM